MNLIVMAIPVFFALIAIELVVAWRTQRKAYRLSDAINDLSCGILQQLAEVFLKAVFFGGYVFLYERYRIVSLPGNAVWVWAACLVGVDLLYYWFHRTSHEVGAVWATHVVHHQSEDFNLAVALRQGAFQGAFSFVFYLPLAIAGFPPLVFLTASSINTLYQFWIHTETIGRLGPLERVLNTPSHHRVHHGRNPEYIDRNLGGMLIVWDRLFGTFEPERSRVVYGITTPLRSWNPLWANVHYWVELFRLAFRAPRLWDKVLYFLKPPGWRPDDAGGPIPAPPVDAGSYRKFDVLLSRPAAGYALFQFALLLVATTFFLFRQQGLTASHRVAGVAFVAASLACIGLWLERRRVAPVLEAGRLAVGAALVVWMLGMPWLWPVVISIASLVAIVLVQTTEPRFPDPLRDHN